MHNNYALTHTTLRNTCYKALQAAIAATQAQARKRKQLVKVRYIHINKKHYSAKLTLVSANAKTLLA